MTECVHIRAPREFFDGPEPVTVHDLQMAHIFRPPRALREHGMREDDEVRISSIIRSGEALLSPDHVNRSLPPTF